MALLVCLSNSLLDHTNDRAIYLDQHFYELIFHQCREESSAFTLLRRIAMLRYKSPTILIPQEELGALIDELEHLANKHRHCQIGEFCKVCRSAMRSDKNLTVSGDMHPELHP